MRVVIADDSVLMREGLSRLLAEAGCAIVATVGTAEDALKEVALNHPDVVVLDIRMPPTFTDEGLRAAAAIRGQHPGVSVLVLSHHIETRYAMQLLQEAPRGTGYLLKDRVSDIAVLVDALARVADDETVIDPTLVTRLMRKGAASSLDVLSEREQAVLALMAEGRSNDGIAESLTMSRRTVETHVRQILRKLDLPDDEADHRRVLAVLTWLRSRP